jgi:hypothetical protein|nr:hypothetical protein [uncultured Oscillibacter sp.]
MSDYQSKTVPVSRGVTLNTLKDELYSLNMRLLLAMQHHNEEAQKNIQAQMTVVQAEIDQMCLGGYRR